MFLASLLLAGWLVDAGKNRQPNVGHFDSDFIRSSAAVVVVVVAGSNVLIAISVPPSRAALVCGLFVRFCRDSSFQFRSQPHTWPERAEI